MNSIFQDGFTYIQASLSLKRTLEKFNYQKSGYLRWMVSFFWSPSLQSTIEKVQRLKTILPDEKSLVSCVFIQLLAEHLTDEDIRCMNFSQLEALRTVRKIDDKELNASQQNFPAAHKNLDNVSLKERFLPDVRLVVNCENFYVSKKALSSASGWFKELFDSAPEQEEFCIWEKDYQGFRLLISHLMGQSVEIPKGSEATFQMYEQAVKYRVRSLIDLYDLKITECYDCFNLKEKVEILKSYPELRTFRKLFDRDYLDVLKENRLSLPTVFLFHIETMELLLLKSRKYLADFALDLVSKQKESADNFLFVRQEFARSISNDKIKEALYKRAALSPSPFLSRLEVIAADDGVLLDSIANYCIDHPEYKEKLSADLEARIEELRVSMMV